MTLLYCRYPECDDVIGRLDQLREALWPLCVISDEVEDFARKIKATEAFVEKEGRDKATFVPLLCVKRNAQESGPQYKVSVVNDGVVEATGVTNRLFVWLVCKGPASAVLLSQLAEFASKIPGATVEHLDQNGRPLSD